MGRSALACASVCRAYPIKAGRTSRPLREL